MDQPEVCTDWVLDHMVCRDWIIDDGSGPRRVVVPLRPRGPSAALAEARTAAANGDPGLRLVLATPVAYRHLVADYLRGVYGYVLAPVSTSGWFGLEVWSRHGKAVRVGRKSRRGAVSSRLRETAADLCLPTLHEWRVSRLHIPPSAHDPWNFTAEAVVWPPGHSRGITGWEDVPEHVLGRAVLDH